MSDLYLKWTRTGRVPSYRGGAPIPYRKWTERVDDPVICVRGWHACRWGDVLDHISDELWVVEVGGPIVAGDNKVAGSRLRIVRKVSGITERTLRLFAADCAESVLPIFERQRPYDDRPRRAIEATRQFANGEIGKHARDAARAAAWDAALAAAWDAALAAAWDAAQAAAHSAAQDAAQAAAHSAARAAARAFARDAARAAFTTNLLVNYGGLNPANFAHQGGQP